MICYSKSLWRRTLVLDVAIGVGVSKYLREVNERETPANTRMKLANAEGAVDLCAA